MNGNISGSGDITRGSNATPFAETSKVPTVPEGGVQDALTEAVSEWRLVGGTEDPIEDFAKSRLVGQVEIDDGDLVFEFRGQALAREIFP